MRISIAAVVLAACGAKAPPPAAPAPAPAPALARTPAPAPATEDPRVRALVELDPTTPRTVDAAMKAADQLGDEHVAAAVDPLIAVATRAPEKKAIAAQIAAIRALGKIGGEPATRALLANVDKTPPPHPRTARDREQTHAFEEAYGLHLGVVGASINALGELAPPEAVKPLVLAMYRTPELFTQARRALVAIGAPAEQQLVRVLEGESAEVKQLFATEHLDRYCGDHGDEPCQPVSAHDFYPAVVIGDFYDPATVPVLLEVLKHPAVPQYYVDDQPGANTQYHAVFDALRKIGSPDAAAPVRALWKSHDVVTATLAVGAYPFLARDTAGIDELAHIAGDNDADDTLRQEAATAYARLATTDKAIATFDSLAKRYFDAAAKKDKEAAPLKKKADAADREYDAQKKKLDDVKAHLLVVVKDSSKSADDIRKETEKAKQAEDAFKDAHRKHKEATAPYKQATNAATAYRGYARMFQTHIARVEVAIRCKADAACYAATLKDTPADAAAHVSKYIKDLGTWTQDEQLGLLEGEIERAVLELGKQGKAANGHLDAMLDAARSDDRLIRQSILLALPKIAPTPCPQCVAKLDAAIAAGEGKSTIADLNLETTLLRNYFRARR